MSEGADRRIHKAGVVFTICSGAEAETAPAFLAVELILQFLMQHAAEKSRQ